MSSSRAIGQRLLEQRDQPQHDRIEMLVHQLGAPFGRVGDLRAERGVVLPALAALDVEVEVGVEEGAQRALDRRLAAGRGVIVVERLHPPLAGHDGTAREDRVEQRLLVVEIVVEQRVVDADALGDVLQRDAVQAVLGEQILGRVEDLLHRLGALLGLARRFTVWLWSPHVLPV